MIFYDNERNTDCYRRSRNFGSTKVLLKPKICRVKCKAFGVLTRTVPWTRNSRMKLSTRMAYGFGNNDNTISMIMPRCYGIGASLP